MAQMASVFAELERAMIRERTRSAMSVKRKRGERISGHAPFGSDFGPGGKLIENALPGAVQVRPLPVPLAAHAAVAARANRRGVRNVRYALSPPSRK